jgi:hypothetical protein
LDGWRSTGGIIAVLILLEDHKAAFVYEFRHRFSLGLRDLGATVPWDEVVYLVAVLLRDPTSWLQTSVNKWDHPITYDWAAQVATYDLLAQVHSKRKPKPYPRPWKSNGTDRKGTVRKDARELLAKARQGEMNWQNKPTPT